jgi:hypothetical protein
VETLGQACLGIATVALLIGSGSGFAAVRMGREGVYWGWRGGALVGVGALLLGIILRGVVAGSGSSSVGWLPLASVANRAALVALMAGLLSVGFDLRRPMGWVELVPVAVVAGVSAASRPVETLVTSAPFLLVCTLVAAGLGLWSAGRGLGVLVSDRKDNLRAATVAFAGLTANVLVVVGVTWRVWGTPGGTGTASVGLLAAWLASAARLVLHRQSVRLTGVLDLLVAALLVVIALSVQWALPFG